MANRVEAYEGPDYIPPLIVQLMGSMLKVLRNWHTTDFASFFSKAREEQIDYVDGMLVAGAILFSIFLIWAFTLIVLKVKGREVGCASGRAFHTEKIDEQDIQSTDSSANSFYSATSSNVINESSRNNSRELSNSNNNKSIKEVLLEDSGIVINEEGEGDDSYDDDDQSHSQSEDYDSQDGWLSVDDDEVRRVINPREKRTRFCFLFFSFISLLCVPIILIFSFGPLKEAATASDDIVFITEDFFSQIWASVDTIESAAQSALILVPEIPNDRGEICPLIRAESFEEELGINLLDLLETVSTQFDEVEAGVTETLFTVKNVITRLSDGIHGFEQTVDETEKYLWIVPGVLFAVSVLVCVTALGVVLAWKNKSGTRIQQFLSYGVLPILIMATTACWLIAIAASFGTMTSSDFCTSGKKMGSPDDTIQEILSIFKSAENKTAYKLVNAYTNRCIGPNPVGDIDEIETMVQDTIDVIWRQLSIVDKIGRAKVIEQCGGGARLADVFTGARNLAKLLTTIRKSLGSTSTSLECQRVNPIYTQIAHVSICTDAASATAYGFLFFLILGISTMTMISLRASWLKNVEEEKVYHDENEIAENMILDEHEEYLAYISRYKHEWQEYHGFDAPTSVAHSNSLSFIDEQSGGSIYFEDMSRENSRSDSESNDSLEMRNEDSYASSDGSDGPEGLDVEIQRSFRVRSPSDDAERPIAIDEISFPSLSNRKSDDSIVVSIREEDFFGGVTSSSLLSPTGFQDETPDRIMIPSTEIILKKSSSKSNPSSSRSTGSGNGATEVKQRALASTGPPLTIDTQASSCSQQHPETPVAAAVAAIVQQREDRTSSSWNEEAAGSTRKEILDVAKEAMIRQTMSEVVGNRNQNESVAIRHSRSERRASKTGPNIGSTRTASRLFGDVLQSGSNDLCEL